MHERDLVLVPSPQSGQVSLQDDHADQPPSTEIKYQDARHYHHHHHHRRRRRHRHHHRRHRRRHHRASKMTYIVSGGALNSTHSLTRHHRRRHRHHRRRHRHRHHRRNRHRHQRRRHHVLSSFIQSLIFQQQNNEMYSVYRQKYTCI